MTEFLGIGWAYPPRIDSRGGVELSAYEQKVRESVWIIISTAKGERVMRPEFGCGIHEFVFWPINETTLAMIRDAVEEALVLWEPRIDVLTIDCEHESGPTASKESELRIGIQYRIRTTNTEFNMVYPFYLRHGG